MLCQQQIVIAVDVEVHVVGANYLCMLLNLAFADDLDAEVLIMKCFLVLSDQ